MRFCTRHWTEVRKCGALLADACARSGRYSCSADERKACSCRDCCLRLLKEREELDEKSAEENRERFFELIAEGG
jgi:hypothetical protein